MKSIIIALSVVALLFVAICIYFFVFALYRKPFVDKAIRKPNKKYPPNYLEYLEKNKDAIKWLNSQPTKLLNITSFDGLKLCGTLLPAKEKTNKTILAVHGYRGRGSSDFALISQFYNKCGYNVLMVDDRAHGQSDGKFVGFGYLDRIDCAYWINFLIDMYGNDCQIVLHGVSMGSATVLMCGGENTAKQVKAIISDCGYTGVMPQLKYQVRHYTHMPSFPIVNIISFLCKIFVGYSFYQANTLDFVKKINIPVLFVHGGADNYVPTSMATELYNACKSKVKNLLIVKGANHTMSYFVDSISYQKEIIKLFKIAEF